MFYFGKIEEQLGPSILSDQWYANHFIISGRFGPIDYIAV